MRARSPRLVKTPLIAHSEFAMPLSRPHCVDLTNARNTAQSPIASSVGKNARDLKQIF
jgi:hypothetical protein